MKQRHWVEIRIARTLGRTILKTEMHNVVYFIMMIICFIHTCLCFVDQSSDIHMLLKWFDPSQFVAPAIIVLALAGPCLIIAFLIVLQFVWGIKQNTIQTTITKHYLIKISSILAFMLAYTLCLPLIKCAVAVQNGQNFVVKIIGISILVVFLVIIYPFSMFLLTDLSPQNNNVYAVVDSPNVLFILNMYRPIASLIVATGHDQYVIIPTVFFFILLLIALLKLPAITWKFNIFSQSLISSILWTILCRFSELATRQKLLLPIYLIGLPIFVLFMVWLLKARVVSILKR